MDRRLAEILDENSAQRRRIVEAIEGLAQAAADWRPAAGEWSVGEVAHHVILAEESIRVAVEKSLARHRAGKRFEPMPEGETALSLGELLARRGVFGKGPLQAAPEFQPTRGRPVGDLVFELERGAAVSKAAFEGLDVELLRALTCPNRNFGLLTLLQWIALIGLHDREHADQMRAIRAHPGFPGDI